MSESDRIRVPTNGHHPPLGVAEAAESSPTAPDTPDEALTPADPRFVFSPGQVAAGFGIIAGLILLIAGSRRRGKRG